MQIQWECSVQVKVQLKRIGRYRPWNMFPGTSLCGSQEHDARQCGQSTNMLRTCCEYVPRQSCIAAERTKNCRFFWANIKTFLAAVWTVFVRIRSYKHQKNVLSSIQVHHNFSKCVHFCLSTSSVILEIYIFCMFSLTSHSHCRLKVTTIRNSRTSVKISDSELLSMLRLKWFRKFGGLPDAPLVESFEGEIVASWSKVPNWNF